MTALDMGITAPCPFCGSRDAPEVQEHPSGDVYAECQECFGCGPPTRIGCRDPEEEDIDLEREALELWNDRGHPEDEVTVEQVYDLCPALEASIAVLEAQDPEVRAASERLDQAIGGIEEHTRALMASLTPKEREIVERRTRLRGGGKNE